MVNCSCGRFNIFQSMFNLLGLQNIIAQKCFQQTALKQASQQISMGKQTMRLIAVLLNCSVC